MSKKHKPRPETYPEDSAATRETLAWLRAQRVPFVRCSRYHIRIGDLNYYPDKGTIYRTDDLAALPETGLAALQRLLTRSGKVAAGRPSSPPAPAARSASTAEPFAPQCSVDSPP